MDHSSWNLELPEISVNSLEENPIRLPLAELFPDTDIRYTKEEYQEHMAETHAFAAAYPGFSVSVNPYAAFRNIEILICAGQYVQVSKSNAPIINFLIYHPKMIEAFEEFVPPIVE